ncbi:uncharacterized protein LOC121377592 [Gigantopelta aegis]|uniref:uncharacterized protein LOC121377592 n=1 Tax=Gigantopelta aegis TaxID=1735272 RepID=UPI001B88E1D4|nr:uncharacterized protein LOC121377592 [Gigantopelta aegis]
MQERFMSGNDKTIDYRFFACEYTPVFVSLYSDQGYMHPLPVGSLPVLMPGLVYVRVSPKDQTALKMILKNCYVVGDGSDSRVLIKNVCEVNLSTHILLLSDVESLFSFSVTSTQSPTHPGDQSHVTCDAKFCSINDKSPSCYHRCRTLMYEPLVG